MAEHQECVRFMNIHLSSLPDFALSASCDIHLGLLGLGMGAGGHEGDAGGLALGSSPRHSLQRQQ